jgi:large subunit ribosomal protein L24
MSNNMTKDTGKKLYKIRLKKGDAIVVRAGKYKGKTGKVVATHPSENKVTVEGINIVKKAIKPTQTNPVGGFKEITKPMWVGKVGLIEPTSKKPSRVGYKLNDDGTKTRVFKSTGKEVK